MNETASGPGATPASDGSIDRTMTSEDVMRIVCRAVAVYYVASMLWSIAQRAGWLLQSDYSDGQLAATILSFLVSVAAMIALPFLVWKLAPTLAHLSEGRLARVRVPGVLAGETIMTLVIATVGVVFLAVGLADLFYALGDFAALKLYETGDPRSSGIATATLARDAITSGGKCVIGLAFMLGPHVLLRLIGRVRRIGLEPGGDAPEDPRPDDSNP